MTVTALATVPQSGAELYRASTDAAHLCKEIVIATAISIKGRKYVKVEGWQSLAVAHGCVASSGEVERVADPSCPGFKAIGKVIRVDTGAVLATAEGFVGDDEGEWMKRPVYARRAMAQTRAISRACRSAFAHVVVMMNAGLETTPAEEVPEKGFTDAHEAEGGTIEEKVAAQTAKVSGGKPTPVRVKVPLPFGQAKDQDAWEAPLGDVQWVANALMENIADPEKAKYRKGNELKLKQLQAVLAVRKGEEE